MSLLIMTNTFDVCVCNKAYESNKLMQSFHLILARIITKVRLGNKLEQRKNAKKKKKKNRYVCVVQVNPT